MKETIPKVIHQIWSGIDGPLPSHFKVMGNIWKEKHPEWQYEYWDNERMNLFVKEHYPQYVRCYQDFKYNVQRWDAIRYLILHQMGGMYIDFDYECIMPLDSLLDGKSCCFAMEPPEHAANFNKSSYFNNALMATIPGHPFMERLLNRVFEQGNPEVYEDKAIEVLQTTGPFMLVDEYEKYDAKEDIYLIPAEYVSPLTKIDVLLYRWGDCSEEQLDVLEKKLEKAYAVHYFMGTWI